MGGYFDTVRFAALRERWPYADKETIYLATYLGERATNRILTHLGYTGRLEHGQWWDGRTYPILRAAQIAEMTEEELLGITNFGRKSLEIVKDVLDRYGYKLSENPKEIHPATADDYAWQRLVAYLEEGAGSD